MKINTSALLDVDTHFGRRSYRILIIGETREFFRFRAEEDIWFLRLRAGQRGRTPKEDVRAQPST